MRSVSKIADFITENIRTIGIVYLIVAAIVFVGVLLFFWFICKAEDEERKLYQYDDNYEPYEYDDLNGASTAMLAFILATGLAILWVAIPVILAGAWLYIKIDEKFPQLTGLGDTDDESEEETK